MLVPLDGSRLAEAALPAAASLAAKRSATVTLLHIIEPDAPESVHGERHLTTEQDAAAYLEDVARRAFPSNAHVVCHVHSAATAAVARGIADQGFELEPDTVVMTMHGRSGWRFLFGSIAQQVAALGTVPVLLVRSDPKERPAEAAPWAPRRIVFPHDNDPIHEQSLEACLELAELYGAAVHLVEVVPRAHQLGGAQALTGTLLPAATRALLDMKDAEAHDELLRHGKEIESKGLRCTVETRRGDPASAIVQARREQDADLIVMGTHGRAGTDAFWTGSVASRVAARARCSLLLVPVRG
ncbi:MAG: universal stress protein [Candidatus Sumerlaeota bacterium]|nr:universal stress protein [Candidatus Sumerlaeota bacterium]